MSYFCVRHAHLAKRKAEMKIKGIDYYSQTMVKDHLDKETTLL